MPGKRSSTRTVHAVALCFVAACAGIGDPADADESPAAAFRVERDVRIPMQDGTTLGALLYRPADDGRALPVIATMTPYLADRFHDVGSDFARHGYVFAAIDSRGRGDSGGEFVPWMSEARDLRDALQWLATRPYCDGRTATWGGSYGGKNQWSAAGLRPRSLATIAPASAGFVGFDMGMRRNIPFSFMQRWLMLVSGRAGNRRLYEDLGYWNALHARVSRGEVSWRAFDALAGNPSPTWQQWVDHPQVDAFWDAASPTDEQFAGIGIPVLSITGLYDDAHLGTLEFRRRHLEHASTQARRRHYTIIGPWDHGGTRAPRARFGGLDFGPQSVLDMKRLHREWYDWVLKNGRRPALLVDRFVYFVAGSNRWAHAADIDAATERRQALFLSSPGRSASSVQERGRLVSEAEAQDPDTYRYDPALAGHNEGVEGEEAVSADYLTDDRSVTRLRGDGLVYDSDAFARGAEVVGRPVVRLMLSMDVADTDIRVQLFEARRDAGPVFLGQDLVRARYRRGARDAIPVTPHEVDAYLFDQFPFVARTLAKGSRLRLVISPVGASIHQQRNRNSGGVVADETARDNRVAHVSVVLGPGLSSMTIPFGR